MRPVSAALLSAVRGSHDAAFRARVVTSFQTGTGPDGVEIPIVAGDVQMDAAAAVRSTLDLTTVPALWPDHATDLLLPYGNEVFVERGVKLGGGVEWVPLGYFGITTVEQRGAPRGAVRIAGRDRMAGIVDGQLTAPRQFTAARTYGSVAAELVADIFPQALVEWDDDTRLLPIGRSVVAEKDRHKFLDDLFASVGKVWWWDERGAVVIRDPPNPTRPVFTVDGGTGGVLVTLAREVSRDGVHNGVVASGEAADTTAPARALVVDQNPDSPTFWGGRFGKVPGFYSSPLITRPEQAAKAAAAQLRLSIGLPFNVDFSAVPLPALEPLDPVEVRTHGVPSRLHVLDKVTVPLVAEQPLTATTREQTFVVLGALSVAGVVEEL